MAEGGAEGDLKKNSASVENHHGVNRGTSFVFVLRAIGNPPAAGDHGDGDERREHDLRQAGMHHGEPVVEKFEHREPAENSLEDYSAHSRDPEPFDPGAFVFAPEDDGESDDE